MGTSAMDFQLHRLVSRLRTQDEDTLNLHRETNNPDPTAPVTSIVGYYPYIMYQSPTI